MSDPKPPNAVQFNETLKFLFEPHRYKVLHGGRGSGKSVGVADALLIEGAAKPLRILCARELQTSIRDSVHKLLGDRIADLGLEGFYTVQQATIFGPNGTEFIFKGLRHNIAEIKSMQGIDRVWIEEAQTVSKASWDTLIPTIRKDGSEIWITFNPELDTDETFRRFVKEPPANAAVVKVNWNQNPWFPEVLRQEKDALKERDPDAYLTVWEGHCRQVLDGAIYANEIRAATAGGRFTRVPYDASKPVHTFWDLGRRDMTSIWFAQTVGFEQRIVDFYQNRGFFIAHYMKALQERPYVYGDHWLPHDAQNELLASERTIEQQMRGAGFKVRIVPKISVATGIDAARTIFGTCWFDETKCADGINSLRRYRYDVDPESGQYSKQPLHDDASHAADAFRYLAIAIREDREAKKLKLGKKPALNLAAPGGWMR